MKIGLVCPYNITKGGGVQEIVNDMFRELTKRGHYVRIITPRPRNMEKAVGPEVLFLGSATDYRAPTHTSASASVSVDTETISQLLEQEQFDILHFHEPWVPVLSRQILTRSKAVNIATFHGVVPETLMSRTVVRVVTPYSISILKYLDELTAVSNAAAEYIRSLTDEPVKIIPNGIDLTRFQRETKPSARRKRSILYLGRLERRKGVKYLLQAFQLLSETEPNVELLIAGDGPDREKLEMLAEDLKLTNVQFLGYVSEARKQKLMQQAALFCSAAVYGESFGIVLLEAMASGAVIVAGNNSGYQSVLEGLGQVSIVDPHDHVEFARRLHLLLNEDELRKLWLAWADGYIQQFSYPKVISHYEELYEQALKKHR